MRHSFCKSTTWCPTFPSCCSILTERPLAGPYFRPCITYWPPVAAYSPHCASHSHLGAEVLWVQRSFRSCATHTVRILKVSSRGAFPLEVVHLEAEAGYGGQHLRHGAVHHQRPAPQPPVSQPLTHRTVTFPPPARIETIK
jgi:hypothetical protein